MIQRLIYQALLDGVTQITADTTIIDRLFEDVLSASEIAVIKTLWAERPPSIRHGYVPRDIEPPVAIWAIVLENESEEEDFLGDHVGMITDTSDLNYGADIEGSVWQHRYGLLCYTDHPDATAYYYEIMKRILVAAHAYFLEQDILKMSLSGMDLAPDPRYVPAHLFARRLVFSCSREFRAIDTDSAEGKAFRVSGIHVDSGGSPSDVGGVKTLVTIGE